MPQSETAMAVVAFEQQMKHARELVLEGRRLVHVAQHDLCLGTVLVKNGHQRLIDTEAYFRAHMQPRR